MWYKLDDILIISEDPIAGAEELTYQEYEEAMKAMEPTEEEIKAEKEAQLRQLLLELYPQEEETANEEK